MAAITDPSRDTAPNQTDTAAGCTHLDSGPDPAANTDGCEECLAMGGRWVHLRLCLTCGHVGCCDASDGTHATAHFERTGHAMIRSHEPGEDWLWCYVDELEP